MIAAVAVGHEPWRALLLLRHAWEVLWALSLGFALSGAVQAVNTTREAAPSPEVIRARLRRVVGHQPPHLPLLLVHDDLARVVWWPALVDEA